MPADFPYMATAKNLKDIFAKIKSAGTPPKFTYEFLKANLGFASSSDRPVIQVLKTLGFLDQDGVPTARYNEYRDSGHSGKAIATGLREGWAEIFLSDQRAYERNSSQLVEIFKSVSGKGEAVAQKMATTFKNLSDLADWSESPIGWIPRPHAATQATQPSTETTVVSGPSASPDGETRLHDLLHKLSLHHDVHVHLPATSDVAVYTAIFRALRTELLD